MRGGRLHNVSTPNQPGTPVQKLNWWASAGHRYRTPLGLRDEAWWMPGGNEIVFAAAEAGRPSRCYLQPIDGGTPRPVTPEDTSRCRMPSPDGRLLFVGATTVFELSSQRFRRLPGLTEQDTPVG